ncbi:antitoxin VapB family protein [Lutibacter sp.]
MKTKNTTITISEETWKRLRSIQGLGETFDELIKRMINELQNYELMGEGQ